LKDTYGVSPTSAPALAQTIADADLDLIPYLFDHLDRRIAAGQVKNPAGLLRVWLESFDAWRPELEAARARAEEARRAAEQVRTKEELMLEWLQEADAEVDKRFAALPAEERDRMRAEGRARLESMSPSVKHWSADQWDHQLDTYVRSELRKECASFEAWASARQAPQ
jgi:hypothetical protein